MAWRADRSGKEAFEENNSWAAVSCLFDSSVLVGSAERLVRKRKSYSFRKSTFRLGSDFFSMQAVLVLISTKVS